KSDAIASALIGKPAWSRPQVAAIWRSWSREAVHSRRKSAGGMGLINGWHCSRGGGARPWGLRFFWHARRPPASSRNRLMRALQAGKSPRAARRLAHIEPDLAPPGGERWRTRSAQVTKRWTCIKRALVRTVGGAKHASSVCLRLPEAVPQADTKRSKAG